MNAAEIHAAAQQERWLRPDADRWLRPDAARFLIPGTDPASVFPVLRRKFNPDQPRVLAGNPDGGQWSGGGGSLQDARPSLLNVNLIPVCILSGASRLTDQHGNKSFNATYDCAGGRTLIRSGVGHAIPGIVRDPFR